MSYRGELIKEDNIVIRVGNSLVQRQTDRGGRGCKLEEHIRGS